MAFKVQRRASGLLSALGIVGQGNTPTEMSETVQPTMDVQLFFDAGRHEIVDASAVTAVVGGNATIDVPAGEAWRLIGLSARFIAGAGGVAPSFWCGARFSQTGNNTVLGYHPEHPTAVLISEEAAAVAILPTALILGPGAQIRAQLATAAPAGSTLICVAAIARYQA